MHTKRIVRVAMTETVDAYRGMPESVDEIACLEECLEDIRRANVDHHLELMEAAAAQGVQAICFGELFAGPYFALRTDPMWRGLAEDVREGPTIAAVRAAAKRLRMIVVAPIYELDSTSGKRFNTAVAVDEHGDILGTYRKTHIPFGKNEQGSFHENVYYEPSDGENLLGPANVSKNPYFPVWQTSIGRIGVAICYDRHFEGVLWSLAKEGAELVFSPAVTFGGKSRRLWRLEFAVDAARHHVFIGGSNRRGAEPPWNQPYFGDTHFVGPNHDVPNLSTHPNLVISELDLGELSEPNIAGWDLDRDIRHDIYSARDRVDD
ncbi:MAG: hypothetical protein HYV09_29555 [Deltaproteobacteria bacterium]|nr:hypothetical protein [Deltaproteobacteria bacterium]